MFVLVVSANATDWSQGIDYVIGPFETLNDAKEYGCKMDPSDSWLWIVRPVLGTYADPNPFSRGVVRVG